MLDCIQGNNQDHHTTIHTTISKSVFILLQIHTYPCSYISYPQNLPIPLPLVVSEHSHLPSSTSIFSLFSYSFHSFSFFTTHLCFSITSELPSWPWLRCQPLTAVVRSHRHQRLRPLHALISPSTIGRRPSDYLGRVLNLAMMRRCGSTCTMAAKISMTAQNSRLVTCHVSQLFLRKIHPSSMDSLSTTRATTNSFSQNAFSRLQVQDPNLSCATINCAVDPVLCNSWLTSPPTVMHISHEFHTPLLAPRVEWRRIFVTNLNSSAIDMESSYRDQSWRGNEVWDGFLHPYTGALGKYGGGKAWGIFKFWFDKLPRWLLGLVATFMIKRFL